MQCYCLKGRITNFINCHGSVIFASIYNYYAKKVVTLKSEEHSNDLQPNKY